MPLLPPHPPEVTLGNMGVRVGATGVREGEELTVVRFPWLREGRGELDEEGESVWGVDDPPGDTVGAVVVVAEKEA